MNRYDTHPEDYYRSFQNLGRAHHVFAALGTAGAAALGATAATAAAVGTGAAALGTTALTVGGSMLANSINKRSGGVGTTGGGKGGTTKQISFTPIEAQQARAVGYEPTQGSSDLLANFPNLASFMRQSTTEQAALREGIMPGAGQQFTNASNSLNSLISGEVPLDVVNNTNRIVAERTGGGFNPFTGGGSSQQAFARSIGTLSTDLMQLGLSAAPAWQQLANSFVTTSMDATNAALGFSNQRFRYDALNSEIDRFNANQRQSAAQYNSAGELQTQGDNRDFEYTSGMNERLYADNAANLQRTQANDTAAMWINGATGLVKAGQGYRSPAAAETPTVTSGASWIPKTQPRSTGSIGSLLY